MLIRPERLHLVEQGSGADNVLDMLVDDVINYGDSLLAIGKTHGLPIRARIVGGKATCAQLRATLQIGWFAGGCAVARPGIGYPERESACLSRGRRHDAHTPSDSTASAAACCNMPARPPPPTTLGPLLITERTIAQTCTLYVNTWGGSYTAAQDAAYFKPFTAATGIQIRTVTARFVRQDQGPGANQAPTSST